MEHLYIQKDLQQPVLILFHGTGGDETSLLQVAELLNPQASVLSLRGDVNEHGMLRFFKRKAEGVYDEEDLAMRGDKLLAFLEQAAQQYAFDLTKAVLVGFSNGANIAIRLLLTAPSQLHRGLLFAPMYPVAVPEADLSDTQVFISTGKNDPLVPVSQSEYVINLFEERGATVAHHWVNSHELTLPAVQAAKTFLQEINQ